MRYLLDTDHLSILQRPSGPAYERLMARLGQYPLTDLAVSIISFHEQVLGCHTYINRARSSDKIVRGYGMLQRLLRMFSAIPVLPYDDAAAAIFDDFVTQRLRLATMDLRIASIALSRRTVLVTRNSSDFDKVPGLPIEDWTM